MGSVAMASDGWLFVIPALVVAVLGAVLLRAGSSLGWPVAILGLLAVGFLAFFFRDPERTAPDDPGVVVAPADGTVLSVAMLPDGRRQIDIFLSVFNVHVNRAPVSGTVISSEYHPGRFLVASRGEAATQNERQDLTMDSPIGAVQFAQIAGILARRIVCRVKPGDRLKIGDRIGLIRFGSRMQVIVPPATEPIVSPGDKVRAGETVIARVARSERVR